MSKPIVVDTSVLISALIGVKGSSREVLRQCLNGNHRPLISNALFHEYEDVSKRSRILNKCPLKESEIKEISTQALAEFDSETRFRALAATGNVERGLELLDKLDAKF